jgi:multiple antibiotic resistance protein
VLALSGVVLLAGRELRRSRSSDAAVATTSILQEIVALLAITNPLGAVPRVPGHHARLVAGRAITRGVRVALAVVVILGVLALVGKSVLAAFGISMSALQAAGGLVVLLMGLEMLHGTPTRDPRDLTRRDDLPQAELDVELIGERGDRQSERCG